MSEEINMDWSKFETALQRRLATSSRDHLMVLSQQARGIMRWIIKITPPGDGSGSVRSDFQRGASAIRGDALGGRRGKKAQTKRSGVFFIASETMIENAHMDHPNGIADKLFVKKDGTVWATEKRFFAPNASVSEMDAHHKRYFKNGSMTSGGARDRVIGRWVFVDRMVVSQDAFDRWMSHKEKKIGWLMGGWTLAAAKLGVQVPAFAERHGAPGQVIFEVSETRLRVVATNGVSYASNLDLERRIQWAIDAQAGAMERQMERYVQTLNKKAGL